MAYPHIPEPETPPPASRSAVFTVKDASRAACNFLWLTLIYISAVLLYEIQNGWNSLLWAGWIVFEHAPKFLASATTLIVAREGGDIMLFHRWAEARERHAQEVANAKNEGRDEGLNEGLDRGRNEVQQQWRAWNTRRLNAEANGEPFDEPPPQ